MRNLFEKVAATEKNEKWTNIIKREESLTPSVYKNKSNPIINKSSEANSNIYYHHHCCYYP